MKKIITLLFAATLFTSSYAQWQNSNEDSNNEARRNDETQYGNNRNGNGNYGNYGNNQNSALTVNAFSTNRFKVTIDYSNEYQSNTNNGYGNSVNVGTLLTGNHTITIYEVKRNFFGKERQQQIYNSVLFFKPNMETIITIDNAGQIAVSEKQLFNNNSGYNNGNGNGYGRKKHKHGNRGRNDRDYDDRRGGGWNNYPNQYPNNGGYYQTINQNDFNNLKQFISKEAFDDRRLNVAKQAASNSSFSTQQVKELMNIFSFDESKLELAKYFYSRTIDRNNYYQLTDALAFGTNKDALLQFIRNSR
jgi:Domain of unknown function (DUF4476)